MKREIKIISLITLSVVAICFTKDFIDNSLINYAIISGVLTLIMVLLTVSFILKTRSDKTIYESFIRGNLKTYDAVMVESNELPNLKGKNIVRVSKFYDLIDAQIEMKKPIYYKKFVDYTVFILLDNQEACVSIVKLNEHVNCEYEKELEDTIKSNMLNDMDKSLLEDIDKTTIIRFDNSKSFKVSPIRKNQDSKEFTPKKYTIRKKNIFCTLNDDTEKRVLIRDIKDVIKVVGNDNKLKNITIQTDEYKFVLKDTSEMALEDVEQKLVDRISKVNVNLKERVEYQEN